MRFHILGLGPIGSLISYHLRRALPNEHVITLIHKSQAQANAASSLGGAIHIENQGIVTAQGGFRSEVFEGRGPVHSSSLDAGNSQISEPQPIDSLFITTKAQHTVPAIRRLLPRLSPKSTIVLMQNGMGIYEELMHQIFRNPEQVPQFILASNTHGVFRKSSHFVHAGMGDISFGIVPDPAGRKFEAVLQDPSIPAPERRLRLSDITAVTGDPLYERYASLRATIAALLLLEPLNVSWQPMSQIQMLMRRKLVVNAVVNPLTALMGCRNGDIFSTYASQRILKRVCQEASDVFAAQIRADFRAQLETLAASGMDTNSMAIKQLPPSLTRLALEEEVLRVAEVTRGNVSSMLADVRRGRSTEVEFINGYLLKLGSTYRVEMPATATLLNLVRMRSAIPIDQML